MNLESKLKHGKTFAKQSPYTVPVRCGQAMSAASSLHFWKGMVQRKQQLKLTSDEQKTLSSYAL
jgi:hypothetical protein